MTCNRAPSGAVTHTRGVVPASPAKRYFGSALEEIHRHREHGRVREQQRHLAAPPPAHGRRGADARHCHEFPQGDGRAEEEWRQAQLLLRHRQRRSVHPPEHPPRLRAPEEALPHRADVVDGPVTQQLALERVGDAQSERSEERGADHMYWPPLMLSCAPVIQSPSVQRNRTRRATSSASPKRPIGIRPLTASFAACGIDAIMSVSTKPGQMAFTVTPYFATSCATLLVNAITPAFAAA